MYLVNMSVSDIIMCVTAVPVTPYTAFHGSWSFGPLFCHTLPLLQGSAIYMSSLSLLGIAWDRYQALQVAHTRTRGRSAEPSAILMVIIIDLSSVCLMIPYCLNMEFSVHEGGEICREEWTGLSRIGFGVTTIVLQFCVPFLVSLYVYLYIIHSLKDRTKEKLRASVHLRKRKTIKAVSRQRSIILLFMLLVFVTCWLPLNLLKLLDDLEVPLVCWPYYYITFFTCHLFAMSSTCWNPILYGHLSRSSGGTGLLRNSPVRYKIPLKKKETIVETSF